MTTLATLPCPNGRDRATLVDQLDRLDRILNGLSDAQNDAVTAAVAAAVGKAGWEAAEAATQVLAARTAQTATITDREESTRRRPRPRLLKEVRATVRRGFASAGRVAVRLFRRLGALLAAL